MLSVVRRSDFVTRLGGDGFAALQGDVDDAEDGARIAQQLVDVLAERFRIEDDEVSVGASIGLAVFPGDRGELDPLFSSADAEADDIDAAATRLEAIGAKRIGFVKRWWVMEAPTGQRFCVVRMRGDAGRGEANRWD